MVLVIPGLYMLGGVGLYAALIHLLAGLRGHHDPVHLLFASLCLITVPYFWALGITLQADSLASFSFGVKLTLTTGALFHMLFPWFIARYTGVRPLPLLLGLSGFFTLLLVVNLARPHGVQFEQLSGLRTLESPWGEIFTRGVGEPSPWMTLAFLGVFVSMGYALHALAHQYRRRRHAASLPMMLAVAVFLATLVASLLSRLLLVDFIEVGAGGFLVMMVLMSLGLTHESQQRLRASEQRFRSLVEQSPFGVQIIAPDGMTRRINAAFQRLWGEAAAGLAACNILRDRPLSVDLAPHIQQALAGQATHTPPFIVTGCGDTAGASPLARERWMRSYLYPIREGDGRIGNVVLMYEDVTEQKHIQDAIGRIAVGISASTGEGFFQQLLASLGGLLEADHAFIGVPARDDEDRIDSVAVWSRDASLHQLSYCLSGSPCADVMAGGGTCAYPRDVARLFPEDTGLVRLGVESYVGTPLFDVAGCLLGILVVLYGEPLTRIERAREIIEIFAMRVSAELERQQAERQIRRMAYYDDLTGLPSRAHLHEYLPSVLQGARKHGRYGALLLIDLDHFKTINDALSHAVGDEVLRAVARRLEDTAGGDAFVARLGGDDFVVVVRTGAADPARAEQAARATAGTILAALRQPLRVGERSFNVGASIGVVLFPAFARTESQLLQHADMAMYRAKARGRGNIQFYSSSMQERAEQRLQLEDGLRRAIDNDELQPYFQPQVAADGRVVGAEVLLRWRHPDLGTIPPDVFIPIAEETGLIHQLGAWLWDRVCARLTTWQREALSTVDHLAVNVSPWQFVKADFVTEVHVALTRHGVDPGLLTLELTESALLYDLDETVAKLTALRELGLTIALDDFGTGYSSFAHLRDLPLDYLKIDKAFVRELSSGVEHPLVESMIAIGRNMKLRVVAEGVETEAERCLLSALGCELFQGYLFSPPLPEEAFLRWLVGHRASLPLSSRAGTGQRAGSIEKDEWT